MTPDHCHINVLNPETKADSARSSHGTSDALPVSRAGVSRWRALELVRPIGFRSGRGLSDGLVAERHITEHTHRGMSGWPCAGAVALTRTCGTTSCSARCDNRPLRQMESVLHLCGTSQQNWFAVGVGQSSPPS